MAGSGARSDPRTPGLSPAPWGCYRQVGAGTSCDAWGQEEGGKQAPLSLWKRPPSRTVSSPQTELTAGALAAILVWDRVVDGRFEKTLASAKAGDAEAQLMLGMMYERGVGTTEDQEQAMRWYLSAAEKGDVNARSVLCERREDGGNRYPISQQHERRWCKR